MSDGKLNSRGEPWPWYSSPLAIASLVLFVLLTILALMGMRAMGAHYNNGLDSQLNRIGAKLLGLALVGGVAVAATWLRAPAWLRWAFAVTAVVAITVGFVWGLPAESHGREIAHNCACEGG